VVLVHLLLTRFRRFPHVVMKQQLALDPAIDLAARRLPQALLDMSDDEACKAQIGALARLGDERGVLLLFPEGGNFTERRRRRAIVGLLRRGKRRQAQRARAMEHVIAPRPGGAVAALRAAPDLDVVFSAHTGLGREAFASELWRRLPSGQTMHVRMWLSAAAERPTDPDALERWLYDWWERMDAWIDAQGHEGDAQA
jgi:1-acyl-sn-glycerol-3-phosphate acyltransferase